VIAENLEAVKKPFGDDLDASRLFDQLAVLSDAASGVSVILKTQFLALLHIFRIATFLSKLGNFCNICMCCQLQLLLESALFHLFVI